MNRPQGGQPLDALPEETTKPVILVIEDDPTVRRILRTACEKGGYRVVEAVDGASATDQMTRACPNLILQDIMLPDIDGFALVKRLRELPGGADIPILALSGYITRVDQARNLATGFTDYLFKPIAPSHLLRVIGWYLPSTAPLSERARSGRRVLLADDDPVQLKLLTLLFERSGFEVTATSDGTDALEAARRDPPDAVVSDVLMSGLDGFRLCLALGRDPRLASIPIFLTSSHSVSNDDLQVARKVGARGLIPNTLDQRALIEAVIAGLTPVPHSTVGASIDLPEEPDPARLNRELEHQIQVSAGLAQRLSLREAEISLLAGAVSLVAKRGNLRVVLDELLQRCLSASGQARGAVWLLEQGHLLLAAQAGYAGAAAVALSDLFGHSDLLDDALGRAEPLVLPGTALSDDRAARLLDAAGAASLFLVGVRTGTEPLAVVLFAAPDGAQEAEWQPFCSAIAEQFAQAISLSRAFEHAEESEPRDREIAEFTIEGMFRFSPQGQLLSANPALARLLGAPSPEELVSGSPRLDDLFAEPDDARGFMRRCELADPVTSEAQLRHRGGRMVWASLSARAVLDEDGMPCFFEGRAKDITERKR
jgi:PAS domain S-box-containing protein